MKTRKIRWAVMFSGMLLLILPHTAFAAPQGVYKQAMHWGLSAEYLDPGTNMGATTSQILLYLFHDALVKPMPSGDYTPSLAESYTISPDAKTYEFKLRRGVKFHNGDLMTAEDVAFSFWRYKSNQAKFIQDKTEKVEIVDPYLIRFHFKEPFPEFLEYLIYGNYPDIQAIWDKYKTAVDPKARKDLIGQVQNLIYEKRMLLPLTSLNSPTGAGPRIKGNPFKIQPLIWFTAPFEDIELQN